MAGSSPLSIVVAASLALAVTACGGSDEADAFDDREETLRSSPLVDGEELHPVMVTSGTCNSQGFRPIESPEACTLANAMLIDSPTVAGPIASGNGGTRHGCTVTAQSTGGSDAYELRTEFSGGTAQQLENQTCSHDAPCVCTEDLGPDDGDASTPSNQTRDVCQDGEFRPDPNKYYTIRSPNGRYIRAAGVGDLIFLTPIEGDASNPYTQPNSFVAFDEDNEPSVTRLQWRFEATEDGFFAINRETGVRLDSGPRNVGAFGGGVILRGLSAEAASPFAFECRDSRVILEQDGLSPADTGGLLLDVPGTLEISLPLVYTEPQSPGFIRARSGCVKKSRSCASMYGEEFEQTGRSLCGFLRRNHKLTCENVLDTPVSMHVPQGWYIEEVTEFSRAVDFDPEPVRVDPLASASSISDSLASFGVSSVGTAGAAFATVGTNSFVAAGSGPLYGALFSISFNAAFQQLGPLLGFGAFAQQDPVAELVAELPNILEELAADINAHTEILITNELVQESARELSARLNERRRQFYLEFPTRRETRLALNDPPETKRLADDVFEDADGLKVDINATLPTLGEGASEDDLRRAHFSLDVAKLATVESMIMLSEGILLEADALPSVSCEQIVADRGLDARAVLLTEKLESAVDELVAFGLAHPSNRTNTSAAEFEFDARHFSYPIDLQVEFLAGIVEATTEKCHRLRDPDDSFRDDFVANTPVLE